MARYPLRKLISNRHRRRYTRSKFPERLSLVRCVKLGMSPRLLSLLFDRTMDKCLRLKLCEKGAAT